MQLQLTTDVINAFHADNFRANFSNFPVIKETMDRLGLNQPLDMRVFDYYVKNITIPEQSLDTMEVNLLNRVQKQMGNQRGNDNLANMTIEFVADKNLLGFFLIYSYIRQMRTGLAPIDTPYYKNVIKYLNVDCYDNIGKIASRLKFKNLFPVSTGTLQLQSGNSSQLTFAVSFVYEDFFVIMFDENGQPLTDENEDEFGTTIQVNP